PALCGPAGDQLADEGVEGRAAVADAGARPDRGVEARRLAVVASGDQLRAISGARRGRAPQAAEADGGRRGPCKQGGAEGGAPVSPQVDHAMPPPVSRVQVRARLAAGRRRDISKTT